MNNLWKRANNLWMPLKKGEASLRRPTHRKLTNVGRRFFGLHQSFNKSKGPKKSRIMIDDKSCVMLLAKGRVYLSTVFCSRCSNRLAHHGIIYIILKQLSVIFGPRWECGWVFSSLKDRHWPTGLPATEIGCSSSTPTITPAPPTPTQQRQLTKQHLQWSTFYGSFYSSSFLTAWMPMTLVYQSV